MIVCDVLIVSDMCDVCDVLVAARKRVGLIKEERRVVPNIPIHSPSFTDFMYTMDR